MAADEGNVAIQLTPPGSGAIAVIRLSGPLNAAFAGRHLSKTPKPLACVYCDLRDGGETIDDVILVQNERGDLDVNLHAGPWVIQATLQLVTKFGYTVTPWAMTELAFDAAESVEAQMLRDLPAAKSKAVLRVLTSQSVAWAAMLAANDLAAMRTALADRSLERALRVPTVAIVGPPNVGKSTLANALFGQERSITADVPGTTRDWVGEFADIDGLVVRLVDTPGVRETNDAIEAAAIRQAGHVVAGADLLLIAIDGSVPIDPAAAAVIERMQAVEAIPRLIVRTKADRPRRCDWPGEAIDVSATRGDGLAKLRNAIHQRLGIDDLSATHARCWTEAQRYKLTQLLKASPASI